MDNKLILKVVQYLFTAINDAIKHDGVEHAGYLSFLLMLSIFPFLVLFVAAVGLIGSYDLSQTLLNFILNSYWADFIDALKPRIVEITSTPPQGIVTMALVSAIWTASSIFEGIRTILNRSYRVNCPPPYLTRRLFSIIEFFVVLGIMVAIMLALVVVPSIWQYVSDALSLPNKFILAPEGSGVRNIILNLLMFMFVSAFYYFLPNRRGRIINTFPGSILMVICCSACSYLFKVYLDNVHSISFIYGSIAGVIIALLYFYFCSLIFIIGGEFNYQCEQGALKRLKSK